MDEYLTAGYHPDVEYVDGVLVERDVPTISHSLLQILLGVYLDVRTIALVSADEYRNSSYRPDVQYVDGVQFSDLWRFRKPALRLSSLRGIAFPT